MGRIELRTSQGFRLNDTFTKLARRLNIKLLNVSASRYTVRFYPGNTQGQFIFILFVRDDFALDKESAIARVYIDDIEVSTIRQIVVQCDKRLSYQKNKVNSTNGTLNYLSRFEPQQIVVRAGDPVTLNLTGYMDYVVVPTETGQLMPYDQALFINYTNTSSDAAWPVTAARVREDPANMIQQFTFTGLTRAGSVALLGSGIPDTFSYNFTVIPNLPSGLYSQVSNEQARITAGSGVGVILI